MFLLCALSPPTGVAGGLMCATATCRYPARAGRLEVWDTMWNKIALLPEQWFPKSQPLQLENVVCLLNWVVPGSRMFWAVTSVAWHSKRMHNMISGEIWLPRTYAAHVYSGEHLHRSRIRRSAHQANGSSQIPDQALHLGSCSPILKYNTLVDYLAINHTLGSILLGPLAIN